MLLGSSHNRDTCSLRKFELQHFKFLKHLESWPAATVNVLVLCAQHFLCQWSYVKHFSSSPTHANDTLLFMHTPHTYLKVQR